VTLWLSLIRDEQENKVPMKKQGTANGERSVTQEDRYSHLKKSCEKVVFANFKLRSCESPNGKWSNPEFYLAKF